MDSASYLRHLRRELDAFRDCLAGGDLAAPIEHCGDWNLFDLAEHLGGENLWSAGAVTERRGDYDPPATPKDPAELVRWFEGTGEVLLQALDADLSDPAWSFHPPQQNVGFWQRRRALETLIHRWDAQHATGTARPLDPELASDGVAEVFEVMAPRQIARGRAWPPDSCVRIEAADTGDWWVFGPGEPVATLSAKAEELLLLLWGRMSGDDAAFTWSGDRESGRSALKGPLVS